MRLAFWKRSGAAPSQGAEASQDAGPTVDDLRWEPVFPELVGTRWWIDRHTVTRLDNGDVRIWRRFKDEHKPSVAYVREHIRKEDFAYKTLELVVPDETPRIMERKDASEWKCTEPGTAVREVIGSLWLIATLIAYQREKNAPNIDGRWVSSAGPVQLQLTLLRRNRLLEGEAELTTGDSTLSYRVSGSLEESESGVLEFRRDPEPLAYFRLIVLIVGDGIALHAILMRSDIEPIAYTLRRPDDDFSPQYAINVRPEDYHEGLPFQGMPWYGRFGDLLFALTLVQLSVGDASALNGFADVVGRGTKQHLAVKGVVVNDLEADGLPGVDLLIGEDYRFTGYLAETGVLRGVARDHDSALPVVIARLGNPELLNASEGQKP